jgi:hypothetical protein
MKVLLYLIFCVLIHFNHLFAEWIPFKGGSLKSKPEINILAQQENLIRLEIILHGIEKYRIVENNVSFQKIKLPGYFALNDIGKPYIPKISELIAVPLDAKLNYRIIDSTITVFENYHLYPAQDGSEDTDKSEFIIDNDFYKKDVLYPGFTTDINEPNIWRD